MRHTRAGVGRHRRTCVRLAIVAVLSCMLAQAVSTPANSASSATTDVTVEVLSSTTLSIDPVGAPPNGCQTSTPNVTSFGSVLPGSGAITTADCNVVWGSSNNSAMLLLYQADGVGRAVDQPWCDAAVACYRFDGSLADDSPTGATMLTGTSPADAAIVDGGPGHESALDFDGDDQATIPYDSAHDLDVYTVDFWFNGAGVDGGHQQLIGKRSDPGTPWTDGLRNFIIQRNGATGIQASLTHSAGTRQDLFGTAAGFNTGWHHIALVSQGNGGKFQLYMDGVLADEVTIAGDVDHPAEPIMVGHRLNGSTYSLVGSLDQLRIQPRDLSAAEIATIVDGTGGPADYDDDDIGADSTWTEGDSMFGACLETATDGAAGGAGVGGWEVAGNDNCTTASSAWNPIARTSGTAGSKVAAVTPGPDSDAAVTLRFGFRAADDQAPGLYTAPLVFEVVAPNTT